MKDYARPRTSIVATTCMKGPLSERAQKSSSSGSDSGEDKSSSTFKSSITSNQQGLYKQQLDFSSPI
jgi:hypothetical protein